MEGAVFKDGHLSVVGQGLKEVPAELAQQYPTTVELDLSNNEICNVENLAEFKQLENLVLDENQLTSNSVFPKLEKLHTLWVNANNIEDLQPFLENINVNLPNLSYLSMYKNPACPNFFTGKQVEEYQRYRYFVLHKIPRLKFLDSSQVTAKEKQEANRIGHLLHVARPDPEQYKKAAPVSPKPSEYKDLPSDVRAPGETRASLGVSRYVYQGRQSEGNRFIGNQDL